LFPLASFSWRDWSASGWQIRHADLLQAQHDKEQETVHQLLLSASDELAQLIDERLKSKPQSEIPGIGGLVDKA
jgi:hypothetical protein